MDPTQVQAIDQPTKFNQITGLDLVQYIDPLNFLAEAVQNEIEQEIEKDVTTSPPASQSAEVLFRKIYI